MRKRRQYAENGLYHIVIRGVNKQNIFFDSEDRKLFLALIKKYCKKYRIKIHAFCLMENHVHLEVEDPELSISLFMQCVCSLYARVFNKKYDRIGHLFQERFVSEIIRNSSYFLTVFRYIMQNPEKAGIAKIADYRWSSYKYYKSDNSLVYRKTLVDIFGSLGQLYQYLEKESDEVCLEIELRPSERETAKIEMIKKILQVDTPLIDPSLPKTKIQKMIRKLRLAGLSIRTIERITGVSKYIIQSA